MSRTGLAALLAIVTIGASVSACGTMNPFHKQVAAQCYWLSNVTNAWEVRGDVQTRAECGRLDSCSGGGGESGGGCYKWTVGANDPQNHW